MHHIRKGVLNSNTIFRLLITWSESSKDSNINQFVILDVLEIEKHLSIQICI